MSLLKVCSSSSRWAITIDFDQTKTMESKISGKSAVNTSMPIFKLRHMVMMKAFLINFIKIILRLLCAIYSVKKCANLNFLSIPNLKLQNELLV